MTIAHQFEYERVKSVKQAISLMKKNLSYSLLAGGTDLIGSIKEGMSHPEVVIDIKGIASLRKISWSEEKQVISIGSLATYSEILTHKNILKHFPLLAEAASMVASRGIRNRATLVGNICSAVPCLDAGSPLMVYEGEVWVEGAEGKRVISIQDWFTGPRKTSLRRGEIVTGVTIMKPSKKYGQAYSKLGRYEGEDLAQATVAVLVLPDGEYRISFGSVAPTPIRAYKIEKILKGHSLLNPELILEAKQMVKNEISPITDIRATKEYRMHMSQVMLERSLKLAQERFSK